MSECHVPHEIHFPYRRSRAPHRPWMARVLLFAVEVLLMTTASFAQATEADDALLRAISGRSLEGFQAALASGASARAVDVNGNSVLQSAVIFWGDTTVIEKLLALGADINGANRAGETPLLRSLQHVHYSSDNDRVDRVVKLLLARGARAGLTDAKGTSPVAAALELGRLPLVQAVLDAGGQLPPDSLINVLALGTNVPLIQFLLDHSNGIDLTLCDASGQTLAHLAAQKEQRLFLLRWLVQHGADLQVRDKHSRTLLATAAQGENVPGMTMLADLHLKLDAVDIDGAQAAHLAAYGARYPVLQWLVERGVDLQARDRWGRRPLDIAIDTHRYAFAKEVDRLALIKLLGGGASDHARGRFLDHPLHLAVRSGNLQEVSRLLDAGADANVKDEAGHTPIRTAIDLASGLPATADQIKFGRQLLPLLLKHGADTRLRMPVTMQSYDEHARDLRFGDELQRLKGKYASPALD
ncbi:MAG: hypothetical protein JWP29_2395 [Rhodoferax sp.]|nr:hypothetical protein [Rhodoferax sp.]